MSTPTGCQIVIELVRIVPVTILGLMAWWISRQQKEINRKQLETNQHKLKFELYERRLKVYDKVTAFLSSPDYARGADFGGDTGATVWYKRSVHNILATTETPA